ncbi:MAG: outer membrane beta-barrel protein [Hyphomonadaceae bacterium]|nr:outer membrane beta-barrel protein [Hyphomonadaceae bacterium]
MKIGFKQIVLSTVFAGLATPVAMAQTADNPFFRGRYTEVASRTQGDFDPEAVRAGAFEIWSSLGLGAEYNTNVFATDGNEDDDTFIRVRPEVLARSNWSVHELTAGVAVDHRDYVTFDSETTTDYRAFVGGRLDVQRPFYLRGRVDAAHVTEPRYEPASSGQLEPAQYDLLSATAGAVFRRDRFQIEGDFTNSEQDFDAAFFDYRDVTENSVFTRASYAVSPDVALFVQGRRSDLDYDSADTDGTRTWIQVGTSFELQAPFRGEIAVGSVNDEKDDLDLVDTDGLSVDGRVFWFPTQLTTVAFRANRGVTDTGVQTSPSVTDTRFGVRVDHELLRNVILFGDIGFGKYEYEEIDREDQFTNFEVGAGYKLNKHARLDFSYRLNNQESSGTQADLLRLNVDQNIFAVGIKFYP